MNHGAILSALSERDETAVVCRDKDGNPEPDPERAIEGDIVRMLAEVTGG